MRIKWDNMGKAAGVEAGPDGARALGPALGQKLCSRFSSVFATEARPSFLSLIAITNCSDYSKKNSHIFEPSLHTYVCIMYVPMYV